MARTMDSCDTATLLAYRDGMLDDDQTSACEAHVKACAACADELARLESRAAQLATGLARLDPATADLPQQAEAAQRLAKALASHRSSQGQPFEGSASMSISDTIRRVWRPLAVGAMATMLVAAMLTLAPVRQAAAEFLNVFRVEQITVVPVGPGQTAQLEQLETFLESASMAQPVMLREPTELESVADVDQAGLRAGFDVREIQGLTDETSLEAVGVAVGPHLRFEVDRPTLELVLAVAGVTDVQLPPMESIDLEVDVPSMVEQTYQVGGSELSVVQMQSPAVSFPPGVPMDQLGEAYLRLLGLESDAAQRMAGEIDWTSTLVMPMPTDAAEYEEIAVAGAPGILISERWQPERPRTFVLLWQSDDIVYLLSGKGTTQSLLLRAAEALQ